MDLSGMFVALSTTMNDFGSTKSDIYAPDRMVLLHIQAVVRPLHRTACLDLVLKHSSCFLRYSITCEYRITHIATGWCRLTSLHNSACLFLSFFGLANMYITFAISRFKVITVPSSPVC